MTSAEADFSSCRYLSFLSILYLFIYLFLYVARPARTVNREEKDSKEGRYCSEREKPALARSLEISVRFSFCLCRFRQDISKRKEGPQQQRKQTTQNRTGRRRAAVGVKARKLEEQQKSERPSKMRKNTAKKKHDECLPFFFLYVDRIMKSCTGGPDLLVHESAFSTFISCSVSRVERGLHGFLDRTEGSAGSFVCLLAGPSIISDGEASSHPFVPLPFCLSSKGRKKNGE
mmetsp:Transcript_14170/g.28402  ORF Transcript_14170/g.28402 Transcript_14170/m.28402 type:complete len:231 (+) Transcript_14170:504-1196(+)